MKFITLNKLSHLSRTSILIASFFAIDKVLAFVKAMLFNKIVGLEGMGIFGAANNIPDYLSALLSGGALGMAFIPVLTEYMDRKGREEAWSLFSRIINLAFIVTGAFSVLIILLANPLVRYVIAPGFLPEKQALTVSLMRLDLVAIVIFSISGLVMSGLQANKHFLLPALAPVLYNLGQIFGVTILSPDEGLWLGGVQLPAFDLGLHGMVYGVILGALLHLLIQVPGLIRYHFRWVPGFGIGSEGVKRVLILLGPRVLTMACIQAYFVARDNLSSNYGTAAVGALNLGWTVEQVPETIVGTAIAVALLPSLSDFVNRGQRVEFTRTVNQSLRMMLAICLPAAALLAVGIRPLASSFFGFDGTQLDLLTACTWAFLLGLVGDTWLEVAVRSFYANQNTRVPLIAAFIQVATFILLSVGLSTALGLVAIPLSAAITFSTQAVVLLILLNRSYPGIMNVTGTILRVIPAALVAGGFAWLGTKVLPLNSWLSALLGMGIGGVAALPFIWKEARSLIHL